MEQCKRAYLEVASDTIMTKSPSLTPTALSFSAFRISFPFNSSCCCWSGTCVCSHNRQYIYYLLCWKHLFFRVNVIFYSGSHFSFLNYSFNHLNYQGNTPFGLVKPSVRLAHTFFPNYHFNYLQNQHEEKKITRFLLPHFSTFTSHSSLQINLNSIVFPFHLPRNTIYTRIACAWPSVRLYVCVCIFLEREIEV